MKAMKSLLAISVLAAAGAAHSVTVATYNVVVSGNAYDWAGTSGLPVETTGDFAGAALMGNSTGTGTATLDDSGVLTITSSFHFSAAVYPTNPVESDLTATSVFQGTYSGGTFTVTSGTETYTSCSGYCSAGFLGGAADGSVVRDYDTEFGFTFGSVTLAGGTAQGDVALAGGSYEALRTFTLTPSEVPVPAAAWLFGSGVIGLMGAARRRRAV